MLQQTFSDFEYAKRRRKTKREKFLDSMTEYVPWKECIQLIQPYYYKNKKGRRPKNIETMFRMYLIQSWFGLSAEGAEEAIYDSYSMRNFLGVNFIDEQVPDATTLLRFRRILDKNQLGGKISDMITDRLEKAGLVMHEGTIADASVSKGPRGTKAGILNTDR